MRITAKNSTLNFEVDVVIAIIMQSMAWVMLFGVLTICRCSKFEFELDSGVVAIHTDRHVLIQNQFDNNRHTHPQLGANFECSYAVTGSHWNRDVQRPLSDCECKHLMPYELHVVCHDVRILEQWFHSNSVIFELYLAVHSECVCACELSIPPRWHAIAIDHR